MVNPYLYTKNTHKSFVQYAILCILAGALGATFTFVNDCGFSVWPGITPWPYINSTGFELKKGNSRSLQPPDNWVGRIWGRTGCGFNESGNWSCATGDCGTGQVECKGNSYTPPVTTVDINIGDPKGLNFYYVSLEDGYNLPILVETTGGSGSGLRSCAKTGCVDDLNQWCPTELTLSGGGACETACQAFGSPEYCCTISITSTDTTCKPTTYAQLFKSACPRSYNSVFDDLNTIYRCNGADYSIRFCPASDSFSTIKHGGQLNSTDQLVSIGGNFTLGFFNEDYSYLGIWYTNDVESRKVWVANPNTPIKSISGSHALSIDANTGDLIIIAGGRTLMSITNVQMGPNPNVTAILEDNGNFRLIDETDKRVLWESFDHPTNVLLPGMKLGYDITTGKNWTLTSWVSNDIPSSGAFTMSWEPIEETSERLMIRRRGKPYWTSGNLNNQVFQYMVALNAPSSKSRYHLTSVYNNETRYFSYDGNISATPMWILTEKGQITDIDNSFWTPEFCYGYDSSNGCVESSLPQCRRVSDNFSKMNGDFANDMTRNAIDEDTNLSISDCFVKCWKDCSCVGFSSSIINGTGCVIWTGSNNFLVNPRDNSTSKYVINHNPIRSGIFNVVYFQLFFLPLINIFEPRSHYAVNKTEKSKNSVWILNGIAILLIFLCFGFFFYIKKIKDSRKEYERRKRDEYFVDLTTSESFKDVHQVETNGRKGNYLLLFSFSAIMAATDDFSVENKLGQGGFGPVYKGQLSDGRKIAIKRLSRTSCQGLVEFKNELVLIAKLQHTNLVRVLGCCIHGEEKMLIYEYMPNKSLDFFLFDENKKGQLDWPKRFDIIEGIAQGLLYLHKYSRMRVIHRDLKASNILLDETMNPKISDFGMARMFKHNETEATTKRVVGTYGYMSPEYAMEGTFSIKSDIFSFGVLILEIVSGRRNSSFVHLDRTFNLIGYAWEKWQLGDALDLKDPKLGNTFVLKQFLRVVHIALLCVQESATDRPTTYDMISMLLNDATPLPMPNRPAFAIGRVESRSNFGETKAKDCSVNNMTITVVEGR
ncbi:hypothetical protein Lser_V15G29946 [Lactuca serriola]